LFFLRLLIITSAPKPPISIGKAAGTGIGAIDALAKETLLNATVVPSSRAKANPGSLCEPTNVAPPDAAEVVEKEGTVSIAFGSPISEELKRRASTDPRQSKPTGSVVVEVSNRRSDTRVRVS
jgi:hypothetical protein